jgi:hypothetical protein
MQRGFFIIARENLILTFIDNYFYLFGSFPKNELILKLSKIVSLNVFQMDGLTYILENQVYGLTPTKIIYRIATSFIFGESTESIKQKNFVRLDDYPYAKAGTLEDKLGEVFE